MTAIWRVQETDAAAPGVGLGRIASLFRAVARYVHVRVKTRQVRRRMHRQLAHLDNRLLHDIGVDPHDMRGNSRNLRGLAEALSVIIGSPDRS